jgi:hypothetical protein
MATTFLQFSTALSELTPEETEWCKKLCSALYSLPDAAWDEDDEDDRSNKSAYLEEHKELGQVAVGIGFDDYGDRISGTDFCVYNGPGSSFAGHALICAEESGNVDYAAALIQAFLERFRPEQAHTLTWSETCSQMRIDEFGGGAILITADWVYFPPDYLQRMAREYTKAKKKGRTLTAARALLKAQREEP